jgi:hypothetical protein
MKNNFIHASPSGRNVNYDEKQLHTLASPSGRNVNYDEKQLHTLASPSGRNVNYDEKQLSGKIIFELFLLSVQGFVNTCPTVFLS